MKIHKDKLPGDRCHPLKSTSLSDALTKADVKAAVTLFHHGGAFWNARAMFSATFYPPGQMVDNEQDLLWIGCRSVPAGVCAIARRHIEEEIIPSLVEWITNLERLPPNSPVRREKQLFERDWRPPGQPV
jgi:hypothetical protein